MLRIALVSSFTLFLNCVPSQAEEDRFPPELVRFKPAQKEPIFTAAGPNHWDAAIRERGWILREGDLWKMWYTGYDGTRDSTKYLGYATSKDGIDWKRYDKNPLYRDHWVEDMMIAKDAGKYRMFAEGKDDQAQMLVSDDGIAWKRIGPLEIHLKNGKPIPAGPFGTPTVWKEGNVWYLFYERDDKGIWLAASTDMKVWTNVQDEPVLSPGPEEYDKDLVAFNQIIRYKDRYYAYYHGSAKTGANQGKWSTNIAASTDLIHWEKYPKNPLLPIEDNRSSGIVVHDGKQFRLYTMHPSVYVYVPAK